MTTDRETLLVRMLERCREQFRFYGDQHMAKDPPQIEKAQVNYNIAAEITGVLVGIAAETVRLPDTKQGE